MFGYRIFRDQTRCDTTNDPSLQKNDSRIHSAPHDCSSKHHRFEDSTMSSKWHEKKARLAEMEFERSLLNAPDDTTKEIVKDAALGKGEEQVFEKKMTKEEKKAAAKAKRDAKKKAKGGGGADDGGDDGDETNDAEKLPNLESLTNALGGENGAATTAHDDGSINHEAADALAAAGTICTFAASRKGVDARSRDINVSNFTMQHMGAVLLDETELLFNHGNRYGLIGRNGSGKSTLLKTIGARAVPIPANIDIFLLSEEVAPSDTLTAIAAVMEVDEERLRLERQADDLNHYLGLLSDRMGDNGNSTNSNDNEESGKTLEEQQEEVMEALTAVYDRLDALDADTAEVRARLILKGLGFTHEMQGKLTRDFSGGWRMRVALARALFISPAFLVLDEPTAHLDMESVIWLEDRLSRYTGILLLVSHSQGTGIDGL
jgi:ATP-binding cassette, subfamily F, member 2